MSEGMYGLLFTNTTRIELCRLVCNETDCICSSCCCCCCCCLVVQLSLLALVDTVWSSMLHNEQLQTAASTNFLHHNHATLLWDMNRRVNFLVMGFFQLIPFCRPIATRLSQCSHFRAGTENHMWVWWSLGLGLVCLETVLVFLAAFDRCCLLRRLLDSLTWLIFTLCSCGLLIVLVILREFCCDHVVLCLSYDVRLQ